MTISHICSDKLSYCYYILYYSSEASSETVCEWTYM